MSIVGEHGYNDSVAEGGEMRPELVQVCNQLASQCVGGSLVVSSCGQGMARWESRTVTIDTEVRTC